MMQDINLLLHIFLGIYVLSSWWFQRCRFYKVFEQSLDLCFPLERYLFSLWPQWGTVQLWTGTIISLLVFIYIRKLYSMLTPSFGHVPNIALKKKVSSLGITAELSLYHQELIFTQIPTETYSQKIYSWNQKSFHKTFWAK